MRTRDSVSGRGQVRRAGGRAVGGRRRGEGRALRGDGQGQMGLWSGEV